MLPSSDLPSDKEQTSMPVTLFTESKVLTYLQVNKKLGQKTCILGCPLIQEIYPSNQKFQSYQ